jgi:hypothetical protein
MPVHVGTDLCLYPDQAIRGSHWEIYNILGVSLQNLTFNNPTGNCWKTRGFAPGMYFVRLTLTYEDGRETKVWKKVVVAQ